MRVDYAQGPCTQATHMLTNSAYQAACVQSLVVLHVATGSRCPHSKCALLARSACQHSGLSAVANAVHTVLGLLAVPAAVGCCEPLTLHIHTFTHAHTHVLCSHAYCLAESASPFLCFGPRSVVSRVLAPCFGAVHGEFQHELQPLATNLPLGARLFTEQHMRVL